MNDESEIDIDALPGGVQSRAIALGTAAMAAFTRALRDEVTYVYSDGEVIACIAPPEAAERYEAAASVLAQPRLHEETIPVLVRTSQDPRPTARWLRTLLGGRR